MDLKAILTAILTLSAGIGVFLIACTMMSNNLESASSKRLKRLFAKTGDSKWLGVAIGTIGTAAIQSSGAVTVMVIGFVNVGIMSLAQAVTAIDIDNWCTENAAENCRLNGISDMEILQGDARLLEGRHFDIILANINRNILLIDMPRYTGSLNQEGLLVMSGFYTQDIPILMEKARTLSLTPVTQRTKDNWAMLILRKQATI